MCDNYERFDVLLCSKLSDNAYLPTKASELAAGFDLYSAYQYEIEPHGKKLILTDIQIAVPMGTYGRIAPRSGLAIGNFIDVGGGVIDADYRGNVGVVLFNFGQNLFKVDKGDRIAQLVCEKISYPKLVLCKELNQTNRGEEGFGSSGV